MKRTANEISEPLAFRVKLNPETTPLFNQLNVWVLDQMKANPYLTKSQALSEIIMGLTAHYLNLPAPGAVTSGLDVGAFRDNLKNELMGELRTWVEGLVNSPERAGQLFEAAQRIENGDSVDADFFDNVMNDIRGGEQ